MPFNIYMLPHAHLSSQKLLQAQLSSMQFLADNSFDFNKLFYESVSYMSMHDYKQYLRDKREKKDAKE